MADRERRDFVRITLREGIGQKATFVYGRRMLRLGPGDVAEFWSRYQSDERGEPLPGKLEAGGEPITRTEWEMILSPSGLFALAKGAEHHGD